MKRRRETSNDYDYDYDVWTSRLSTVLPDNIMAQVMRTGPTIADLKALYTRLVDKSTHEVAKLQ